MTSNKLRDIKSGQVMEMRIIEDDFIIKELKYKTLFDKKIMELMSNGDFYLSLWDYYNEIKKTEINIVEMVNMKITDKLTIIQKYISGVNLKNYEIEVANGIASNNEEVGILFCYVEKVISYQCSLYNHNPNLRLDLNTQNFIINNKELIFVDITPPLYVDRMISEDIYSIYFTLFKEIVGQWICFYGYLCKTLISVIGEENSILLKKSILLYFNNFSEIILKIWGEDNLNIFKQKIDKINSDKYSQNVFYNKIFLTFEFLSNKIDSKIYKDLFNKNSFQEKYLNEMLYKMEE